MLVRLNEKERKKMNRIAKWDNAKFVLIILVVICHFYENYLGSSKLVNSLFFSVYTFHMPAFFAVSGWFAGEASYEKIVRRIHQLLIPYVLWALLFFLWHNNLTVNTLWLMVIKPDSSYWFLWVLFWIYLIGYICLPSVNHQQCNFSYKTIYSQYQQ